MVNRWGLLLVPAVVGVTTLAAVPHASRDDGASAASATSAHDTAYARALQLLQRATFGVRPGDVQRVLAVGRDAWLDEQLHPQRIDDSALDARLQRDYPAMELDVAGLLREFPPPDRKATATAAARRAAAQRARQLLADMVGAKLERAVYSRRQLQEVMTDFWFNHFNVFAAKGADRWLVEDFENRAIRPHVFGTFEQLLRATAEHPAMLFFLDNWRSTAPDSEPTLVPRRVQPRAAARTGRAARALRGINENYGRELMELHTLGVTGGYTQQDVIEVARAFTGWTLIPPQALARARANPRLARELPRNIQPWGFIFRPALHDAGSKIVLGHTLPAGRGMADGLQVLHMLATSPATAHHIAFELAQWFVADSPPASLVDRLTRTYLRTGGDLRAVTRTLFTAPELYAAADRGAKFKTPFQFLASALRVTDADLRPPPRALLGALYKLGQVPYMQSSPAGWPSTNAGWVSGGGLLDRMNVALALAVGRLPDARPDPALLRLSVPAMLARVLPGADTTTIMAAVRADAGDPARRISPERRALALALGSPAFQRH